MANEFKVKNGLKFPDGTIQITAASSGGGTVYIGTSPPASPTSGYLWWDSSGGALKVYYDDGSSSQWVDAFNSGSGIIYVDSGGSGGSGTSAETPSAATFTYDSSGYLTQMVETFSGGNKTTTYSYNPDYSINTETSVYLGVTKTTTYYYTNGRLTSYTVT